MGDRSRNMSDEIFEPTPWTWIQSLRNKPTPEETAKQIERLSKRYWSCVYAYLRRCGRDSESARDITQGFFADVILRRGLFRRADKRIGRFRDLLAWHVRCYNVDWIRGESAIGRDLIRFDDELPGVESQLRDYSTLSPQEVFDRRWATCTLVEAAQRCEQYFRRTGRSHYWEAYQRRVFHPSLYGTAQPSYRQVCAELGFATTQRVANAIYAVNVKFRHFLREVIGETVGDDDRTTQEEYDALRALLGLRWTE